LAAKIVSIDDLIESLKINEDDKGFSLGRLDRSDWDLFIPEQTKEQVYYLILSTLEEEKEKLEKEFESL
jgi:hypothetical protein